MHELNICYEGEITSQLASKFLSFLEKKNPRILTYFTNSNPPGKIYWGAISYFVLKEDMSLTLELLKEAAKGRLSDNLESRLEDKIIKKVKERYHPNIYVKRKLYRDFFSKRFCKLLEEFF